METLLGRWLLIGLILLIALALFLLVSAAFRAAEPEPPATVVPPTAIPATAHAAAPTRTPSPIPSSPPPSPTPVPPSLTPTLTPSPTPSPTATPLPVQIGYAVHVVSSGETLEQIAERYGSIPEAAAALNRFALQAALGEGQPLVLPLFAGLVPSEPFDVRGLEVERGLAGRRVALTFDAGASADPAALILDTLLEHDTQVTFFLTGKFVEENPALVRRMAAEGHEFANHTYSHPDLTELDDETVREQVDKTERLIGELLGKSTRPLFRPPFGARNQHVLNLLAEEGYISIYWTVDSWDSVGEPKTPEFLFQRVTHPTDSWGNPISLEGAIVLMHVGSEPTAQALPSILDWFQQEGWEVVRVSEILRPPEGAP